MKILVLGHMGMLGHMLYRYLLTMRCEVLTISEKWPSHEFKDNVINFTRNSGVNYIVNCIGSIPQKKNNDFNINVDLPIWLDNEIDYNSNNIKIIYPGTDMDEEKCDYGLSKKKAKEFIISESKNTKMIRTSIIGPELKSKSCTFEWFMNSKSKIYGWNKNYWNGITTLEWSKMCYDMMLNWNSYKVLNTPFIKCISKYELLKIINKVFNKNIIIYKNPDVKINRCLEGDIEVKNIRQQLIELKEFYYDN